MKTTVAKSIDYLIAMIWLVNGLFCKVLHMVPRHEQIVARILGTGHSRLFTTIIGFSEVLMAVWIISGIKPRLNVIMQTVVIATMNTIEFFLAADLLLWGRVNAIFALLLISIIYFNGFVLKNKPTQ